MSQGSSGSTRGLSLARTTMGMLDGTEKGTGGHDESSWVRAGVRAAAIPGGHPWVGPPCVPCCAAPHLPTPLCCAASRPLSLAVISF